jgi:hypothetical protein
MAELLAETNQDKENFQKKLQASKKSLQNVNDEFLNRKIEYDREIALSK